MSAWGTKWHIGPNTKEIEVDSGALKDWPITPIGADKFTQHGNSIEGWSVSNSIARSHQKIERIERHNKVPTHDPYTNPNSFLYYECKCGQILDPGVKRFAALNEAASEAGWKIRFGELYYIPYCVECGKDVE